MKKESCQQSLKVLCHFWPLDDQKRAVNFLEQVASALSRRGQIVTKAELLYEGLHKLKSGVPRSDFQLAPSYEVIVTEATEEEALRLLKQIFPESSILLILDNLEQGQYLRDTFNSLGIDIFYCRPGPGALVHHWFMEGEVSKFIGELDNLVRVKTASQYDAQAPAR